jgi:hypothetical protein
LSVAPSRRSASATTNGLRYSTAATGRPKRAWRRRGGALAEAEAELGATTQLRAWLERTAGRHPLWTNKPFRHVAYADLAGVGAEANERPAPVIEAVEGEGSQRPDLSPDARALLLKERAARHDAISEEGSTNA